MLIETAWCAFSLPTLGADRANERGERPFLPPRRYGDERESANQIRLGERSR
jgi:hypothetical protein